MKTQETTKKSPSKEKVQLRVWGDKKKAVLGYFAKGLKKDKAAWQKVADEVGCELRYVGDVETWMNGLLEKTSYYGRTHKTIAKNVLDEIGADAPKTEKKAASKKATSKKATSKKSSKKRTSKSAKKKANDKAPSVETKAEKKEENAKSA